MYSHWRDKVWFVPGADRIRALYEEQVRRASAAPRRPGRRRRAYDALENDDAVRICVDLSEAGDSAFDDAYLIDRYTPRPLTDCIQALARAVLDQTVNGNAT